MFVANVTFGPDFRPFLGQEKSIELPPRDTDSDGDGIADNGTPDYDYEARVEEVPGGDAKFRLEDNRGKI